MNKLPLETLRELIRLRNKLDAVSQISWSFSILNKQHPVAKIEEESALTLIKTYQEFIQDLKKLIDEV